MRKKRFLSPWHETAASVFHTVSRIVGREHVLGREEKYVFVKIMRQYEAFFGVQVLSYCIMSNHFHILVEVPPKTLGAPVEMSDEVFLTKLRAMYTKEYFREIELMLHQFRTGAEKNDKAAEELKAKFTCRMYDISEFMKGVKQRFSTWFNKKHDRVGTLWESRFKSVLVESGYATRVISAYIDLNPIRAGMVSRPEYYLWSSYGEAMKLKDDEFKTRARAGIRRVLGEKQLSINHVPENASEEGGEWNWDEEVGAPYRMMLFSDGEEVFTDRPELGVVHQRVRCGFKREEVAKVLASGGKISFGESMLCRVRYYNDGIAVGSRVFLEDIFGKTKGRFGEKRKSGARPIPEVGWKDKDTRLYSMCQLRKDVVG